VAQKRYFAVLRLQIKLDKNQTLLQSFFALNLSVKALIAYIPPDIATEWLKNALL